MRRSAARGFTMIELVVVISVIGIIAMIGLPRLVNRLPEEERGVKDALTMMLRHARKVAVAQQRRTCVLVDATATPTVIRAVYAGATCGAAGTPLVDPGTSDAYVDTVPNIGIALAGTRVFSFNASGQPVNPVTAAVLTANQTITIGSQRPLAIVYETGFVYTP